MKGIRKTGFILLPLITYFIAHDLVQMGLYMGINMVVAKSERVASLLMGISSSLLSLIQLLSMGVGTLCVCGCIIIEKRYGLHKFVKMDRHMEEKETSVENGDCCANRNHKLLREEIGYGKVQVVNHNMTVNIIIDILLAVAFSFALNVVILQSGFVAIDTDFSAVSENQSSVPVICAVLLFGMVSPVVEEFIFRKVLYGRLKIVFPVSIAVVLSALFFGIYHGNIVQGVYGFLMGIYLVCMYEKYQEVLFIPILCHGVTNIFVYFTGNLDVFMHTSLWIGVLVFLVSLCLFMIWQKDFLKVWGTGE